MIHSATLPTLPAGRVVLRWLTGADIPALFTIFSHPEVMRYWSSAPLKDLGEAQALLEGIQDSFRRKELYQWGVALKAGDKVIGTCTLLHLDPRNRRAEVGYALGRVYWGQGLMSEALGALFDYAFTTLGLHRLEADVDPRNAPSLRILERLGFQREGMLRERWLVGEETQDSLLLGLLDREWLARRAAG